MFPPDINVWLALAFDSQKHHLRAKGWFDGLTTEACYFCRFTQQGFLRLATNRKAFGSDAVTMTSAWHLYDTFLRDPRIAFSVEPTGLEADWRNFTAIQSFSPRAWSDAYIAAFAKAALWQPVTFDQDFHGFAGTNPVILI